MAKFFTDAGHRHLAWIGLPALAIVLAAAVAWHWRDQAAAQAAADGHGPAGILMQLAAKAQADGRLVAPQGSNVYEFYASVLQLEPGNPIAIATLRQVLPQALADIETTIDQGELDEAQREIYLLHDYAPDNYTLLLLAGKLNGQRAVEARRHEAEAMAIRAREGRRGEGF